MGSILNFVFESKETENGTEFNEPGYKRFYPSAYHDVLFWKEENKNLYTKTYNYSIAKNSKNIFLLESGNNWGILDRVNGKTIFDTFPDTFIQKIRTNQIKIVLACVGEATEYTNEYFEKLKQLLNKYGLNESHLILIDGNISINEFKNNFKKYGSLHFLVTNHRPEAGENDLGYTTQLPTEEEVNNRLERSKHFLSLNRAPRPHRVYYFSHLYEAKLLDKGYFSFLTPIDLKHYGGVFGKYKKYKDEINNLIPIELDTIKLEWPKQGFFTGNTLYKEHYLDSYFNITTETFFFEKATFFTEKTLKPILGLQPFIMISTAHFLKYFKEMGFKTFDSIWDESYDEEEDDFLRMQKILNLIEEISNWSLDTCKEKYKLVIDICIYNRNHLYNNIYTDRELETIIETIKNEW